MNIETYGFIGLNNIKFEDKEKGIFSIDLEEKHLNPYEIAHGGVIYSLADTAMGIYLLKYGTFVTLESNINFVKTAKCKKLITKVEEVKIGANIAVLNCTIFNENNEEIAFSTGTYYKYNIKK